LAVTGQPKAKIVLQRRTNPIGLHPNATFSIITLSWLSYLQQMSRPAIDGHYDCTIFRLEKALQDVLYSAKKTTTTRAMVIVTTMAIQPSKSVTQHQRSLSISNMKNLETRTEHQPLLFSCLIFHYLLLSFFFHIYGAHRMELTWYQNKNDRLVYKRRVANWRTSTIEFSIFPLFLTLLFSYFFRYVRGTHH